jgi:hypothetical protein
MEIFIKFNKSPPKPTQTELPVPEALVEEKTKISTC